MLWLWTLACVESAPPPSPPSEPPKPPPVTLDLVPGELAADGTRTLGLRFRIPAGWHIYWLNPGDSGLPTSAELRGAADGTVQGPLWPGPERFTAPGDIVSYGYAEEATAVFRVPEPAAGTTLTAAADWLACKEICVRGQGEATLTLPAAPEDLSAALARLPQPLSAWPGFAMLKGDTSLMLSLGDATEAELFPGVALAEVLTEATLAGPTFRIGLRATPSALDGVLRVRKAGEAPVYLDLSTRQEDL